MVSSLYLHIPFCRAKCSYCSFSSFAGMEAIHAAYLDALESEITALSERFGKQARLSTIFVGGGTPTVFSGQMLARLLRKCLSSFTVEDGREISVEANPGTVSTEKLSILREAGFNRLSIGVQSFSEVELGMLGRGHTPEEAVKAVESAKSAGFDNISLDLMYGIPRQDTVSWQHNLDSALALSPQHLSLYQLTFEEDTPLAKRYDAGELGPVDEDTVLEMDEYNQAATGRHGLTMYEISNFSLAGFECRHNCNYWLNNEYFAAGAGAVSYVGGRRERRHGDPLRYIREIGGGEAGIAQREQLSPDETFRETVIMGLRMRRGVSLDRLQGRFGIDLVEYYGPVLDRLMDESLIELSAGHLRVTAKGRLFSNRVMAELV